MAKEVATGAGGTSANEENRKDKYGSSKGTGRMKRRATKEEPLCNESR